MLSSSYATECAIIIAVRPEGRGGSAAHWWPLDAAGEKQRLSGLPPST